MTICRRNLTWLLAVGLFCSYLSWLFALEICRSYLPWLFAVGICRGYLPWEFAAAVCRENLPWVCSVYVIKTFSCVSKTFLNVSKTFFLFMRISLLTVFLLVIAVKVMGHRTTKRNEIVLEIDNRKKNQKLLLRNQH